MAEVGHKAEFILRIRRHLDQLIQKRRLRRGDLFDKRQADGRLGRLLHIPKTDKMVAFQRMLRLIIPRQKGKDWAAALFDLIAEDAWSQKLAKSNRIITFFSTYKRPLDLPMA